MHNSPLLSVKNLRTWFYTREGCVKSVDDVSFQVEAGQILGIVGESGSGKSVTGCSILGLVDPPGLIEGGSILYQGEELVGQTERELRALRGNKIAMVFQDPMMTLNPVLSVETQMVEAVLVHNNCTVQEARNRAVESLAKVGIPSPEARIKDYPHHFSGGMRQRVAIAIALLNQPDLIIADEPTTALDVTVQAQILAEMQALCNDIGTALIWITHDLSVVAQLANTVCVMYAGQMVESGPTADVIAKPQHHYTQGLINSLPTGRNLVSRLHPIPGAMPSPLKLPSGCRFRPRCSAADDLCLHTPTEVAEAGRNTRCWHPLADSPLIMERDSTPVRAKADTNASAAILEFLGITHRFAPPLDVIEKIAKRFGVKVSQRIVHAVDGVNLTINSGKIVGLVGESGCGKSTLGRIAARLIQPTAGSVKFQGESPTSANRNIADSLAVQMVFQDPFASLNSRMRVLDIISEAPVHHKLIRAADREAAVVDILEKVGLDPSYLKHYPHQFSGGQRQRLGIARALAVNPKVIVCDESIAALDVSIQAHILDLFLTLRADMNISLLFISHDLGVVEYITDEVAVMYLGRIVEKGATKNVFSKPSHPYTQALITEVPELRGGSRQFTTIKGEVPSPLSPPSGCHFHPRCPHTTDTCKRVAPPLQKVGEVHYSACHLNE